MHRFADKTVIVTGAGSGIGAGTVQAFAREGANLVLVGRTRAKLEAVAAGLPSEHVAVSVGDVSDPDVASATVELAVERFGALDVLVNNAAAFVTGDIEATETKDFLRLIDVNVGGYFHMAKAAMPELKKTRGAIVMVSSVSGMGGDWGMVAYNSSKGAIDNMVRALALDHGKDCVRVNAVNPSFTDTEITKPMQNEATLAKFMERIPMGRIGTPEDVARVILFLASTEAGFVTGVTLPVDGGLSASNGQPNMGA